MPGVKQVFPELVAQVHIYFLESAFAVDEVVKVLIDESPCLVVLGKLLTLVFQKIGLVFLLVEEIIPFIYDGFKPSASDSFCFL